MLQCSLSRLEAICRGVRPGRLGFRVKGLGLMVQLGVVKGSGCRIQAGGVQGVGFSIQRLKVQVFGLGVQVGGLTWGL